MYDIWLVTFIRGNFVSHTLVYLDRNHALADIRAWRSLPADGFNDFCTTIEGREAHRDAHCSCMFY